jgi:hypothetical protein
MGKDSSKDRRRGKGKGERSKADGFESLLVWK